MIKRLIALAFVAAMLGVKAGHVSAQIAIAHWSFDTGTITQGVGGRIESAADQTGVHNATALYNGTGVDITSAAAQFGDGALFGNGTGSQSTNNASFTFPQLTEIAGPTGGDFSIATWVKTTNTASSNTILATWISSSNNYTYWFSLASVDSSSASRPRGQFRSSNSPNTDIVAVTLAAGDPTSNNVADNNWHHIAWTWTKSTKTLLTYVDGVASNPTVSGQSNVDILPSASPVGHMGRKADTNNFFSGTLDEIWVFNGALTQQQVDTLLDSNTPPEPVASTTLTLRVDPFNGRMVLMNGTADPITLTSYQVTSASAALDVSKWNPIANGNEYEEEFPAWYEDDIGWEAGPNASNSELVEWYLAGDSTLEPGQRMHLGKVFNPAGAHDVVFQYSLPDETVKTGSVEYIAFPVQPVNGDYNDNDIADAADYVLWRKNVGTTNTLANDPIGGEIDEDQYNQWRANFGKPATPMATLGAGSSVPEPMTVAMFLIAVALCQLTWSRSAGSAARR